MPGDQARGSAVADAAADYVGYCRAGNDEEKRGAGYDNRREEWLISVRGSYRDSVLFRKGEGTVYLRCGKVDRKEFRRG
jgi:hypothetical protein